ncbi:MAG: biotin/lipoyl-binding protein, partial [Planctomycetes bacterium]|nr:biotin/lipoyl-binding protein [Planctomycetota bacterium]
MLERLRRNQSLLIAVVLVGGLLVWMWPAFEPGSAPREGSGSPAPAAAQAAASTRVRVATLAAEDIQRELVVQGHTEPARAVTLKAEVDGRVVEIGAERGTRVAAGDLVVRLDARDREARVREARALVRQRELQYEAVRRLEERSFQSQTQVAESLADLEAARATLRQAEVALANTEIRAPLDGV